MKIEDAKKRVGQLANDYDEARRHVSSTVQYVLVDERDRIAIQTVLDHVAALEKGVAK